MSAVLLITKNKKLIAKVSVAGTSFVIGRSKDCNLPLNEPLASRQHADVVFERGAYWVMDCGSRNGTLVNGEKISAKRILQDGDEIEIGSTRLTFVWDKNRADEEDLDDDKTRVAASYVAKKSQGQPVKKKKNNEELEVKLRVVDGPLQGGFFCDWESPLTIGRGLDNNVVLLDDAVSTTHAEIVQEGDSYFIVDLKSANGTFLDGVKVQRTKLSNGQKIRVGVSTLVFEMVNLRKKRRTLRIALISTGLIMVAAAAVKYFQPPDIAGRHIALARNYEGQGDLTNALEEYQAALTLDPNRTEAKRELAEVKEELEARDILAMANLAAAAENYDKAKELCFRVLRDFPNNLKALELQAVIESIENAQIAFASRNWSDAKDLLQKAQETYPQSELLRLRLAQANSELTSEQNLAQAKDDLNHQQLDMAEPLLQSIPTNSVYYVDARQALDQIALSRQIAEYLNQARAFYENGNITKALNEIDAGLQQAPNAPPLLELQGHIRQMNGLLQPLEAAEALNTTYDVDALLQARQACQDVIALEPDPLNAFNKRAQAAKSRISENLVQTAQADAASAADSLQSGNEKDAMRLYDLAARANPDDQGIATQRDKLHQKIDAECHELYDQGIVHQDLQQDDLARQDFQQILNIGSSGEKYYDMATSRLKDMTQ